jgi:glycosyltransferase involved in cell wall biosynthesis
MKTLLFHVDFFLAGGIEKVLIELLQGLGPTRYKVMLSIGYNMGIHEVLKPQIPPHVSIHYLLEKESLIFARRKKMTGHLPLHEKLYDDLIIPPLRRRAQRKRLVELAAQADVLIDFDMTLAPYIDSVTGVRKVAYCHFSFTHYWGGNKRKLDKLARRLAQYDCTVMLCDEMRENAVGRYPALAPRMVRIYNALNLKKVRRAALEPLPDDAGVVPDNYIVSVGRLLESQKDFTTLLKAYALCVREHNITEQLVLVGDGGSRKDLERLASSLGILERIVFTGYQANPYKWVARAALFAFSSKYEGLPTVLIEALALYRPIVATACPSGVKEVVMQGEAGIYTPPGDAAALAAGIHRLLRDDALQDQFRNRSEDVLRQFDVRYMVQEFDRLVVEGSFVEGV